MKTLIFVRNEYSETNHNSMCSLYNAFIEAPSWAIKPLIEKELDNNNIPMDYQFNRSAIRINNNKTFTIYMLNEDDPSYYLTITMENYWKAIGEYEEIKKTAWKKLTISFDGNQVYFDPEY